MNISNFKFLEVDILDLQVVVFFNISNFQIFKTFKMKSAQTGSIFGDPEESRFVTSQLQRVGNISRRNFCPEPLKTIERSRQTEDIGTLRLVFQWWID